MALHNIRSKLFVINLRINILNLHWNTLRCLESMYVDRSSFASEKK